MPGQRELKARLRSVCSTGKLTGAMRTVSAAKYARAEAALRAFAPYEEACLRVLSEVRSLTASPEAAGHARPCFLALTGNRGLCGAYNSDVLRFLREKTAAAREPVVLLCGRYAVSRYRASPGETVITFPVSDLPTEAEAGAIAAYLLDGRARGELGEITVVMQKGKNVLTHEPTAEPFAVSTPPSGARAERQYHPSREALAGQTETLCFRAGIYGLLLRAAAGVQGATLVAMRSASDNAELMRKHLEQRLNRMRQSAVTTEVVEIAGSTSGGD